MVLAWFGGILGQESTEVAGWGYPSLSKQLESSQEQWRSIGTKPALPLDHHKSLTLDLVIFTRYVQLV